MRMCFKAIFRRGKEARKSCLVHSLFWHLFKVPWNLIGCLVVCRRYSQMAKYENFKAQRMLFEDFGWESESGF